MPREGLEPPPLARPEPKSGASANFATGAYLYLSVSIILIIFIWCLFLVSIQVPMPYQDIALPIELKRLILEEKVGFEPTDRCRSSDFKSGALNHSTTSPLFGGQCRICTYGISCFAGKRIRLLCQLTTVIFSCHFE